MPKHSRKPWNVDVPPEGGVVVCDADGAVLLRFEDYDEAVLDEDALLVAAVSKTAAERDRLKALNAEMLAALQLVAKNGPTMAIAWVSVSGVVHKAIAKSEGRD